MIENIEETIETLNSVTQELRTQANLIYKIKREAEHGWVANIEESEAWKFSVDNECVNIKVCYEYEENCDYYSLKKEWFGMSEKELVSLFAEMFKEVIGRREMDKKEREIKAKTEQEERDRAEFKRLNAKYRGRRDGEE